MKYINYTTWSDTNPYEVLEMSASGKSAKVRMMSAERSNADEDHHSIGGFFCHVSHGKNGQKWSFSSNEEAWVETMTLRKNGTWQFKGQPMSHHGCRGRLSDEPYKYYDYNF